MIKIKVRVFLGDKEIMKNKNNSLLKKLNDSYWKYIYNLFSKKIDFISELRDITPKEVSIMIFFIMIKYDLNRLEKNSLIKNGWRIRFEYLNDIRRTIFRNLSFEKERYIKFISIDGHKCYSFEELKIDNYLSFHKIKHEKPISAKGKEYYPDKKWFPDWVIGDLMIEYFGGIKCDPKWDYYEKFKMKLKSIRDNNLNVLMLFPDDDCIDIIKEKIK